MENPALKKMQHEPLAECPGERKFRPRSMTTLKLQWLAERVRRCRQIQLAIEEGTYHVDSREVAKALLNLNLHDE